MLKIKICCECNVYIMALSVLFSQGKRVTQNDLICLALSSGRISVQISHFRRMAAAKLCACVL